MYHHRNIKGLIKVSIKNRFRFKRKKIKKKPKLKIFIVLFLVIINIFISFFLQRMKLIVKYNYKQDDVTLVSAYYKIKSKHTPEEYFTWLNNFVLLNRSLVFFSNKEFMPTIKELRPKEYHSKTVFIELEMEDFYSYKNFYQDFERSFKIDPENSYHTIPLYLIWAEKCTFVKKAISENYFNSKCFYWIDVGYFREDKSVMPKYASINWPKSDKCLADERIVMGQVKEYSEKEKQRIANFDLNAIHSLMRNGNVAGCFFGGQIKNTLKFINYYYDTIRLFIKNKLFIGKDQNLFAFVVFSHPEIVQLFLFRDYFEFKIHLQ